MPHHTRTNPIPRTDTPPRAPTPEWRIERVPDMDRRMTPVDLCPSCGAPAPLSASLRASFGRGWSTVPSRTYNALSVAPQRTIDPCIHWVGVAASLGEAKALLPQGGVARARHATDAQERARAGVDSRWRCWRPDDDNGHVAQ